MAGGRSPSQEPEDLRCSIVRGNQFHVRDFEARTSDIGENAEVS